MSDDPTKTPNTNLKLDYKKLWNSPPSQEQLENLFGIKNKTKIKVKEKMFYYLSHLDGHLGWQSQI